VISILYMWFNILSYFVIEIENVKKKGRERHLPDSHL
jgi:hypothetical protein